MQSADRIEIQKASAIGQVNGYLRGLDRWHRYADSDCLCAGVVMFALDDTYEKAQKPMIGFDPAVVVSRDNLYSFLEDYFDGFCDPVPNPHRWLHSFESMGRPYDKIFNDIADYAFDHYDTMPVLDDDEKADIRRRIADRLGIRKTAHLKPLVAALTNGRWELRDAVVQILENLPQERLETLFKGWLNQK